MARFHRQEFVGRQWALDHIADWLRSDAYALVVSGGPGTGKTALVGALAAARYAGGPADRIPHAVHVCRANVSATTDPTRVFASIASQLARSVPGYRVVARGLHGRPNAADPARMAARTVLDYVSPAAAFDSVLAEPFEMLASHRGRHADDNRDRDVVVVIDGLDERRPGIATSTLTSMFADRLATRVPGLRLLLTTRPGLALAPLGPTARLDLDTDSPPRAGDVHEYLDYLDPAGTLPRMTRAAVADAAGSCYLYADVAMRLAAAEGGPAVLYDLPGGLSGLYKRALDRLGCAEPFADLALSVLAGTWDAGLTAEQLAAVICADRSDVVAVLHRARPLLTGNRRVRPHHRCLSEQLWAMTMDPPALDWVIAQNLQAWHVTHADRGSYWLRNVWAHLANVAASEGAAPARRALNDSITDVDHLMSALLDVNVDDLLSTLSYAGRRLNPRDDELIKVARILRGQARQLRVARRRRDRVLLAQQIVYGASTVSERRLARGFARRLGDAGILTLWATTDHPDRLDSDPNRGHAGPVTTVGMTGDGTRAVTTSADRTTRIWRLASGRLVHTTHCPTTVLSMYPRTGGSQVVAAAGDGKAQIWDAESGVLVGEMTGGRTAQVTAFAAAENGAIGVGGDPGGQATVWDLTTGEPTMRLACPAGLVSAVAITPDGGFAATATVHGHVTVWDISTGARLSHLAVDEYVNALSLSPKIDRLVLGGSGLAAYSLVAGHCPILMAELTTAHEVTAVAINPVMPNYVLFGSDTGQVGYVRLPVQHPM
jgi:hypothetical protein